MTKVQSTLTLHQPTTISGLTPKQYEAKLRRTLSSSRKRQQALIRQHQATDCTGRTLYSSSAARVLTGGPAVEAGRLAASRVREMDQSEAYRILGAWQQRRKVAEWLAARSWDATYQEARVAFPYLKINQYRNLQRARCLPALPKVEAPRLPTSKSDSQFLRLSYQGGVIRLERMALWDSWVDLTFRLPERVLRRHPHIVKVTRPTIYLKDGKLAWDFTLIEEVPQEAKDDKSVVGVDLGVAKLFTAARVWQDGIYGEELVPSKYTQRHEAKADALTIEIDRLALKNKRRVALGCPKATAVAEEARLRGKRLRVQEAADWNAATDLVAHASPGEELVLEDLRFNQGGTVGRNKRFRSHSLASKVEHRASRAGKRVRRVGAQYSSQSCPECGLVGVVVRERLLECSKCGWLADRDYTAAVVLGLRGVGAPRARARDRSKCGPTPKQPRPQARASLGLLSSRGGGSTGPALLGVTGGSRATATPSPLVGASLAFYEATGPPPCGFSE